MKRRFALFLACVMLFSAMPVQVFAEDGSSYPIEEIDPVEDANLMENMGLTETMDLSTEETSADSEDRDSLITGSGRLKIKEYTVEEIITVLMYFVLGLLIVVGLGLSGRYFCRTFGYDPFHRYSREQCLVFIFQSFYIRMQKLGLPQNTDSQSEEFLLFCEAELNKRHPEVSDLLRPSVEKLYRSCFGGEPASQDDISAMRRILLASYR